MASAAHAASTNTQPQLLPIIGPVISNIVCGANLNCRFDLRHIGLHCRNAVYKPRFPAAIVRIRSPTRATGLIFATGKLQVLGCRTVADCRLVCRKFGRILQKLGYKPRIEGFNVQNIVASADTQMLIRLEGLAADHYQWARYEPECFPGLCYQVLNPRVKVLVFAKGKVVFVGAKTVEEVEEAAQKIYPLLRQYRRA